MKLSEIAEKINPKVLLFGAPGCGKTVFTASLGEGLKIVDVDGNIMSAKTTKDALTADRLKIDVERVEDANPYTKAESYIKTKRLIINEVNDILSGKSKTKFFAVDSLTSLADGAMRYVLWNSGKLGKELPLVVGTDKSALYQYQPSQPEWGLMISEIEMIISLLRSLPIPVILTAHSEVEDVNGAQKYVISIPTKKLPPKLPGYFTEVWYMQTVLGAGNVTRRVLRTVASPSFLARSCYNLPDNLDTTPGLRKIFTDMGVQIN